jgi:hypothetical protein
MVVVVVIVVGEGGAVRGSMASTGLDGIAMSMSMGEDGAVASMLRVVSMSVGGV